MADEQSAGTTYSTANAGDISGSGEQSGSDEVSGASADTWADLGGNGQYLVFQQLDANGDVTGYIRIDIEDADTKCSGGIKETIQSALTNTEGDDTGFSGVATSEQVTLVNTFLVVIVLALFMSFGAICVRTLVRAFER